MDDGGSDLKIGIGPTDQLSLRVSVAALARVVFEHPDHNELTLALERKATLLDRDGERIVEIRSQPFGGALQILHAEALRQAIGDFHFDSERSHREQDFRVFIEPTAWAAVQEFCLYHFGQADDRVLESDPARELTEEFDRTLDVSLTPDQFHSRLVETVIEGVPSATKNYFARGALTARIYRIFETQIVDRSLARRMVTRSEAFSEQDLRDLALKDHETGGRGWTNTVLTLPLKQVRDFYASTPLAARNQTVSFRGHWLDETVAVVLQAVPVPKDHRT
jgi:hypothetical protein